VEKNDGVKQFEKPYSNDEASESKVVGPLVLKVVIKLDGAGSEESQRKGERDLKSPQSAVKGRNIDVHDH